jgi:hypothetical protein
MERPGGMRARRPAHDRTQDLVEDTDGSHGCTHLIGQDGINLSISAINRIVSFRATTIFW